MASTHLYTRSGDGGMTSLVGGSRVSKDDTRVEAYGALDEANAAVGLARTAASSEHMRELLGFVQQRLFNCSSRLATPDDALGDDTPVVTTQDVAALELWTDYLSERSGPLTGFVLPGGHESAARLHIARTAVRRAERRLVTLDTAEPVDAQLFAFVNRLSDLLFAAARYANIEARTPETTWDASLTPPDPPPPLIA